LLTSVNRGSFDPKTGITTSTSTRKKYLHFCQDSLKKYLKDTRWWNDQTTSGQKYEITPKFWPAI